MTNTIAGFRPAHPAHFENDEQTVNRGEDVADPNWRGIKQVLIDLYIGGAVGPATLEGIFKAIPELRDA